MGFALDFALTTKRSKLTWTNVLMNNHLAVIHFHVLYCITVQIHVYMIHSRISTCVSIRDMFVIQNSENKVTCTKRANVVSSISIT